ncbi:DUF5590 domain-containing protein [Oceanobacillus rekensis]|uniref:cell wall elongation regulator TseB-like domain-containing protein n=1 Tax=Oceanobacillus rekensis TaxID=937927 RepID=UPI001FE61706|nr:DUF5590 domain-containing protein [Oceanobacillus rekensis]
MWSSILLLVIILACIIYAVYLYNDLYNSKTAGFDETKEQILNQTSIAEIEKIEQYNGSSPYHVVFALNEANEEKLIFYPVEGKEKELTTINRSEIITAEEVLSLWQAQCNECELVKINPALENNEPLWEITYHDNQNRYVMEYLSIYDGAPVESYRFKKMF